MRSGQVSYVLHLLYDMRMLNDFLHRARQVVSHLASYATNTREERRLHAGQHAFLDQLSCEIRFTPLQKWEVNDFQPRPTYRRLEYQIRNGSLSYSLGEEEYRRHKNQVPIVRSFVIIRDGDKMLVHLSNGSIAESLFRTIHDRFQNADATLPSNFRAAHDERDGKE